MQDFKTGHLTLTSARGKSKVEYKAPYALIYRNMAILGVRGVSDLPSHCLQLCYGFFTFAVAANLLIDFVPMAMLPSFSLCGKK
ncbi:hypothetical protein LIER_22503 [Lithospermum erythrorhizon]|uniref:Uncharacterized protein n=1 Tax=Lithospermum erythrorhizon TaxID=34254 RepID=A0AAV3QXK1_LITER